LKPIIELSQEIITISRGMDVNNMESSDSLYISVHGKILKCPVCNNKHFWHRTTLMNTSGMTFMGWEWLNKEANNYICEKCGYVYWFFEVPSGAIQIVRGKKGSDGPERKDKGKPKKRTYDPSKNPENLPPPPGWGDK
jgi:hypothetical protein